MVPEQTESTLQENEERLRLVAQGTNDALYDWDMRANTVWRSDGYYRLLGISQTMMDSRDWWLERIHPDDQQAVKDRLKMLEDGHLQTWTMDYRVRHQNGHYADIADRAYVVQSVDGSPLRVVGALTDVTERKRAERALRESEKNARRFQEQLRTLHEVGIELDSVDSLDELCRMAVELGRSRLGFDRLGLWLYEQDNTIARGAFGTDEHGQIIDERGMSIPPAEY